MAEEPDKITCQKCGRTMKATEKFYKMKNGERYPMCKTCLTQNIDNRNPDTFMWILEKFDVPYIQTSWIELTNKVYRKNPGKFGPSSVLGLYLRSMNMLQYRDYTFADTARLNQSPAEKDAESLQALKDKLERGEITQAEYDAWTSGNDSTAFDKRIDRTMLKNEAKLIKEDMEVEAALAELQGKKTPFFADRVKDEKYWAKQLSDEDIDFLMLKWGYAYSPEQWIAMETMYNKYIDEYDMTADREEVLKKMCKTSLKMDEAIDNGDTTAYKNLATVFDQLRKSGRFTEAQKKDDKVETLSTIGELVALCEREGGIIKNYPKYDDSKYTEDKIDITIKDLQRYTHNLAVNELGLGDLIESYIDKLDKAEASAAEVEASLEEKFDPTKFEEEEEEDFDNMSLDDDDALGMGIGGV